MSDAITIDASNAGTEIPATVFEDPQVLTDLSVVKVDASDDAVLDGAVFQLYLDGRRRGR